MATNKFKDAAKKLKTEVPNSETEQVDIDLVKSENDLNESLSKEKNNLNITTKNNVKSKTNQRRNSKKPVINSIVDNLGPNTKPIGISFTLSPEVVSELNDLSNKSGIKKSKLVDNILRDVLIKKV